MTDYYAKHLSGDHLFQVYALADEAIQRYLNAELNFCLAQIPADARVLELGCGYGRFIKPLARAVREVIGIDVATRSLDLARKYTADLANVSFVEMNAASLSFDNASFDAIVCIQNGICAFREEPEILVAGAMRCVTRSGMCVFTTYADHFWDERVRWFRQQSERGLLGPLDEANTRDGVIACTDGFRSGSLRPDEFKALARSLDVAVEVTTLPEGSVAAVFRRA